MFPIQDTIPARHFPLMNYILIAVNVLVFIFESSLSEKDVKILFYIFGLVPARYTHPEWAELLGIPLDNYWPFLTNMFLHGSLMHLLGNVWTLWIFGDNVEDRMGSFRYLLFYLICGLFAGLTHFLTNIHSTVPAVGASGAISGVMAAYMWMFPQSRILFVFPLFFIPFFFELHSFIYIGIWFLGQLISGTSALFESEDKAGIAFWAHIGGFMAGLLIYKLFLRKWYGKQHSHPYVYRYKNYY